MWHGILVIATWQLWKPKTMWALCAQRNLVPTYATYGVPNNTQNFTTRLTWHESQSQRLPGRLCSWPFGVSCLKLIQGGANEYKILNHVYYIASAISWPVKDFRFKTHLSGVRQGFISAIWPKGRPSHPEQSWAFVFQACSKIVASEFEWICQQMQ